MGQARRRGTYEDRRDQAIRREQRRKCVTWLAIVAIVAALIAFTEMFMKHA